MRWCRPASPVEPMYMPGRLRTGSRPSSTWMSLAPYSAPGRAVPVVLSVDTGGSFHRHLGHAFRSVTGSSASADHVHRRTGSAPDGASGGPEGTDQRCV